MNEQQMGLREVRDGLGHRVDAAHYLGEATVITKSGEPRAALVPYGWYRRHQDATTPDPASPPA